jgi:hypothetical protein
LSRTELCFTFYFWIFEALVIAAVIARLSAGLHRSAFDGVVGLTFCLAFVGLLVASLTLRHAARRLAVLGYISPTLDGRVTVTSSALITNC